MKGQASGTTVFIYIFSAIIAGLILLYGVNVIKGWNEDSLTLQTNQVKRDISNLVEEYTAAYGSVHTQSITVPSTYEELCFISSVYVGNDRVTNLPAGLTLRQYPIIYDGVTSGALANMFLYPDGEENTYVGAIEVESDFACYQVKNGKVILRVESLGNRVQLYAVN